MTGMLQVNIRDSKSEVVVMKHPEGFDLRDVFV